MQFWLIVGILWFREMSMTPKPIILDLGYTKLFDEIQEITHFQTLFSEISKSQNSNMLEQTCSSNLDTFKFENFKFRRSKFWKCGNLVLGFLSCECLEFWCLKIHFVEKCRHWGFEMFETWKRIIHLLIEY